VQAEAGPEAFAELHRILFEYQPAEGTAGPSDAQLVAWAVEAGADETAVRPGIEGGEYDQFVVNATDQMSKDGVNGTPTVLVDGELVEGTPADAVAAVREAVS
jgi:protein-disulfide isomerase